MVSIHQQFLPHQRLQLPLTIFWIPAKPPLSAKNKMWRLRILIRLSKSIPAFQKHIVLGDTVTYSSSSMQKREAISSKPYDLTPKDPTHISRESIFILTHEYDRAIEDCSTAIRLGTRKYNALSQRGEAYYAMGEFKLAILDSNEASRIYPNDATSYYIRGRALASTGESERAIDDLNTALNLSSDRAKVYRARASVYLNKGDIDKAIADCGKAIALSPSDAGAHAIRGLAFAKQGDYRQGITDCRKATDLDGNNYLGAANNLAWLLAVCPDAELRKRDGSGKIWDQSL